MRHPRWNRNSHTKKPPTKVIETEQGYVLVGSRKAQRLRWNTKRTQCDSKANELQNCEVNRKRNLFFVKSATSTACFRIQNVCRSAGGFEGSGRAHCPQSGPSLRCPTTHIGHHFPSDGALLNATTWHGTTLPNDSVYAVIDLRCLY